jgi:molybdopterin-guanine dinucleotide biosynthesis protein B
VKVAAITGRSGSGKTTLIVELIRRFAAEGRSVGAIKHTHHPLNEEHRGDTARFLDAGARPVLLASAGEAVIFGENAPRRVRFASPAELLTHFAVDIVLVEGFARFGDWPRLEIDRDHRLTADEALARIWCSE